jgi:hypothetical protein
MSFRTRMKNKKDSLKSRHNTPSKSNAFPTIFNKSKIPEGVNFFICREGQHIVDILPWEAGPDMPLDDTGASPITEEGELDYVLDLFVHQNVGPMNQPYVCPWENFRQPCPICEYIKANRLPKEEWSKLRAKRRSIYLIWNRTTAEEEKKGVQIFDSAHFFMEEKLDEIARLPRGGGYITFSDPDEGKSVCWTRKGAGKENTSYLGHKFIDRESKIPDRILDATFALDQVINMHPSYEEIDEAFNGAPAKKKKSEDEDSSKTSKEGKKKLKPKKKVKVKKKSEDIPF